MLWPTGHQWLPVLVNEVLLEHGHSLLFKYICTVCTTAAELSDCDKDHVAHKTGNIYSLALHRKNVLTLVCK